MLPPKQRQESFNNNVGPRKSILKKTNSFNLKTYAPTSPHSPNITPYTTITGTEHRIRSAFEAIFRKSNTLQDVQPDPDAASITPAVSANEVPLVQRAPSISKKVQLVCKTATIFFVCCFLFFVAGWVICALLQGFPYFKRICFCIEHYSVSLLTLPSFVFTSSVQASTKYYGVCGPRA